MKYNLSILILLMSTSLYAQWNPDNNSCTGNLTLGGIINISGNQIRFSENRGFDYDATLDAAFFNGNNNGRVVKLGDQVGNGWFLGSLGVGTNLPEAPLHIRLSTVSSINEIGLTIDRGSNPQSSSPRGIGMVFKDGTNNTLIGGIAAIRNNSAVNFSGDLAFFTNSGASSSTTFAQMSERMRISSGGFLGIGITTPTQRLSVFGQGVFLESTAAPDPGDQAGSATRIGYTSSNGGYGYINANNTGVLPKNLALQQNGGNVGIGTYAPDHLLQIGSASNAVSLSLRGPDSNALSGSLVFEDNGGTGSKWFKLVNNTVDNFLHFSSPEQTYLLSFNRVSGNLGVGTYATNAKFDIAQTGGGSGSANGLLIRAGNSNNFYGNNQVLFSYNGTANYSHAIKTRHDGGNVLGNAIDFYVWKPGDATGGVGSNHVMSLNGGNVGIGTRNPDHKLDVKGIVHAEEVLVDLSVPAPDYVFESDYNLATLEEVETYLKENKHLPEVPSAKEMEQNGMNLAMMNLLLLKKVEELTLHLIEQNKKLSEQLEVNQQQAEEIKLIKLQMDDISGR